MLFRLSKDWAIYTGISFLTCLATILPITRVGIGLLILGYTGFGVARVFIDRSTIEKLGQGDNEKAMRWAISFNSPDMIFLAIAIIAGIFLGIKF